GIGLGNFTPEHLVVGVREGIATELLDFYGRLPGARRAEITGLVGSGNAIRRNGALRQVFERRLGLRMKVPAHREETSFGAALLAGVASGTFPDLAAAGALVRYES
ncbi:MAG TPA: FGGY-family carbohydrate kinase, partial [Spirochaetia bacterium]|nr:FGGY-family carbohydrate kinase [Spirochaetia bacterium]